VTTGNLGTAQLDAQPHGTTMDRRPAVLLIGLLIALGGCGGSRASATGPVATYRTRVNAVCAASNRKLVQLTNLRSIAATEDAVIDQIKPIKLLASRSATVASWLVYAQRAATDTFELAIAKGEHAAMVRAAFLMSAHDAYARAHAVGLNSCAVVGAI
jgi:hypothetical protein